MREFRSSRLNMYIVNPSNNVCLGNNIITRESKVRENIYKIVFHAILLGQIRFSLVKLHTKRYRLLGRAQSENIYEIVLHAILLGQIRFSLIKLYTKRHRLRNLGRSPPFFIGKFQRKYCDEAD